MLTKTEITRQDFERLLAKLAPDEQAAASEYERIRAGLVRFYTFRGCDEPEDLADETINRVAIKLATVDFDGAAKFSTYFYAFASRIHLEYLRAGRRVRERAAEVEALYQGREPDEAADERHGCLEKCLGELRPAERELLLGYYGPDKAKAEVRRRLAATAGISAEALHTRVSRLRGTVAKCVRACLAA